MQHSPELERLAHDWVATRQPTIFAALADGLRKAGATEDAWSVVVEGVTRYPGFVPGRLVEAAVLRERGAAAAAEAVLREGLARDPDHPLLREALGEPTTADEAPGSAPLDPELAFPSAEEPDDPPALEESGLLSESLAALYHRQGHLEQAVTAYAALADRYPGERRFAERRMALESQLALQRPLPFAAAEAGGQPVSAWLSAIATAEPKRPRPTGDGFDAFYRPPLAPPEATTDFAAFQRWLEELGR